MSDSKPKTSNKKFTVFHIEGGIGKHVAATAAISAYKKSNPYRDIVIVCAWPEVFLGNDDVSRIYRLGHVPYFYEDFIYDKDVEVFAHDPYRQSSHITKKKHLAATWCDMIGTKYNGEKPKIHFNLREKDLVDPELTKIEKTKPLLIFQPFGGPGKDHQPHNYSWVRDIHPNIAQQLVNVLSEKYIIIHVCYNFHPQLEKVIRFEKECSKKELFNLLRFSDKRLLIDSALQHAAAAMELPSTVVWVGTSPDTFGYKLHNNILPIKSFPAGHVDSYLYDYNFTGQVYECPYKDFTEIHSVEKILKDF